MYKRYPIVTVQMSVDFVSVAMVTYFLHADGCFTNPHESSLVNEALHKLREYQVHV